MLKRESLRDQIREEIRTRIINGELTESTGISEIELAKQLGVSRTPLREALITLEQEGFLEASPGKGFSVLPMNKSEYLNLVPIIGALEKLTLLACPKLSKEEAAELRDINAELLATDQLRDHKERITTRLRTDLLWHEVLLERSTNDKALQLLRQLKAQWRRYEYIFWEYTDTTERSVREHEEIVKALLAGKSEKAGELIDKQWRLCLVDRIGERVP
ncbi:MAG: GntR family transcriptional regulator [Bdellovibrionales bacterium]|nr:GntR family transcriptional regulator [Bdellovibrionales bacterium]